MIVYDLVCAEGHRYEAWFASAAAYAKLVESGALTCEVCGSTEVAKALSAPAVNTKSRPGPATPQAVLTGADAEKAAKLRTLMAEVKAHVDSTFTDVGPRFAEQARKMHYGEVDEQPIRGEATGEDVQALWDEGIEALPLPLPREDA